MMLVWAIVALLLPGTPLHDAMQASGDVAVPCPVDGGVTEPAVAIGRPTRPRVRKQAIADPPQSFLDASVDGRVVVSGIVDTGGSLCNLRVVTSAPTGLGLEEAGIASAKGWRFAPATRDGVAVRAPVTIEFTFSAYTHDPRRPGSRGRTAGANIDGADLLPRGARPVPE